MNRPIAKGFIPLKYAAHPGFRILFPSQLAFLFEFEPLPLMRSPTACTKRNDFCVSEPGAPTVAHTDLFLKPVAVFRPLLPRASQGSRYTH
jgi:hypothetical protein